MDQDSLIAQIKTLRSQVEVTTKQDLRINQILDKLSPSIKELKAVIAFLKKKLKSKKPDDSGKVIPDPAIPVEERPDTVRTSGGNPSGSDASKVEPHNIPSEESSDFTADPVFEEFFGSGDLPPPVEPTPENVAGLPTETPSVPRGPEVPPAATPEPSPPSGEEAPDVSKPEDKPEAGAGEGLAGIAEVKDAEVNTEQEQTPLKEDIQENEIGDRPTFKIGGTDLVEETEFEINNDNFQWSTYELLNSANEEHDNPLFAGNMMALGIRYMDADTNDWNNLMMDDILKVDEDLPKGYQSKFFGQTSNLQVQKKLVESRDIPQGFVKKQTVDFISSVPDDPDDHIKGVNGIMDTLGQTNKNGRITTKPVFLKAGFEGNPFDDFTDIIPESEFAIERQVLYQSMA